VPAAAAIAVGLVVFGTGSLFRPPRGGSAPEVSAADPGATAPSAGAASTTSTTGTTASTARSVPATVASTRAGAGRPAVTVADDGTVELDGVRYGLGAPGDLVSIGDWDCDGADTAALVRRASGEVFLFDGWARAGADAVARRVRIVAGPVTGSSAVGDGSCDVLVVTAADGTVTEVRS
jgi:hypothetical protein